MASSSPTTTALAPSLVAHRHLVYFADKHVNLKREDVSELKEQVNRLREKLEAYITEHPDYDLVKMLHAGSVAKGTALKVVSDMDVAVYIRPSAATVDEKNLQNWLAARLREAYSNLDPSQIIPKDHCVTINFRGTGLDVDVVPVLYENGKEDRGYLITKDTGDRVLTSIPLHLAFIRKRKEENPKHFRQVVRFVKWWVRQRRADDNAFRFKSFMVELLCAHLADSNLIELSDYPLALEQFFAYVVQSELRERIYFTDNYEASELPADDGTPIQIFDPVNPENNVAKRYTDLERQKIVDAAQDALDALTEAHHATTKGRALAKWQSVLGPSFTTDE